MYKRQIYTKNVTAFCNFLATRIARAKRHRKLIYITRNLLARFIRFENELIGVRIRFKGRIDGRPRAKKMYLQKGSVPLHTVSAAISYHLSHVFSRYGTFGVRIWLCFTKSNTEYFYEYKLKQEQLKQEEEERKEKEEIINSGLGKNEIDFMLKRVVKKKKKLDYIIEDYHKNLVPRPSYIIPKDKRFENFNEKINKSTGGGLYNKKSFILWYFLYKYNVKNKSILNEKFFIKLMLLLYKTPGEKKTYYSNLINKIFKTQLLLNIYHINKKD